MQKVAFWPEIRCKYCQRQLFWRTHFFAHTKSTKNGEGFLENALFWRENGQNYRFWGEKGHLL